MRKPQPVPAATTGIFAPVLSWTLGTPASTGMGSVLQGFLETSNVNAVSEITSLITAQRAYEMNAKVITATDEMMSVTSNVK